MTSIQQLPASVEIQFPVQLTLTPSQIQGALDAFGPDDSSEGDLGGITFAEDKSGKIFAWDAEYPEEGLICLDDFSAVGIDGLPDDVLHPLSAESIIQPGDIDE